MSAVTNHSNDTSQSSYFGDKFFAPEFSPINRSITGHHADGSAHIVVQDQGEHHLLRKSAANEFAETVLYTTFGSPVDLNGNDDLQAAREGWQVSLHSFLKHLYVHLAFVLEAWKQDLRPVSGRTPRSEWHTGHSVRPSAWRRKSNAPRRIDRLQPRPRG